MVRNPGRAGSFHEILEAAKMFPVGSAGGTEIHRNSVLHDSVLLQYLIEDVKRAPPVNHEVLGNDFKPAHDRLASQYVIVVGRPQPHSDPAVGEIVESICTPVSLQAQMKNKSHRSHPAPHH